MHLVFKTQRWEGIAVSPLCLANLFSLLSIIGKTAGCSVDYFNNCMWMLWNLGNSLHEEDFGSEIVCGSSKEAEQREANLISLITCLVLLTESRKYFTFLFNPRGLDPTSSQRKRGLMMLLLLLAYPPTLLWTVTQHPSKWSSTSWMRWCLLGLELLPEGDKETQGTRGWLLPFDVFENM